MMGKFKSSAAHTKSSVSKRNRAENGNENQDGALPTQKRIQGHQIIVEGDADIDGTNTDGAPETAEDEMGETIVLQACTCPEKS